MTTTCIPIVDRFWPKVEKTKTCWLWTASKDQNGYGRIGTGRRGHSDYAHRVSWKLVNGDVPVGMFVLHDCDTPSCVNPAHLRIGTQKDNMADCASRGRSARGEKQGSSKLNTDQVEAIRRVVKAGGWTQKRIATFFGVSQAQVSHIANRRQWQHI